MKVLSLTEPYATLVKIGTKTIETRSWKTDYRGKIYIHASSTKIPKESKENTELMSLIGETPLNFGNIIVECELTDCIKMTQEFIDSVRTTDYKNFATGIYAPDRYAWILKNVKVLENPILAKGHLGLWNYEGNDDI